MRVYSGMYINLTKLKQVQQFFIFILNAQQYYLYTFD